MRCPVPSPERAPSMTPPAAAALKPVPAAAAPAAPARGEAVGTQRRHNEGHGRRLTAAFEALEAFPALAESRDRVIRLANADRISVADIVGAVESDVAL